MGSSSSKLKKRRTQSIAWSFKLGTGRGRKKLMAPIIVTQAPHLDISTWLDVLDMQQYAKTFERFAGVEELMYFCEGDIKQMGVKNSAHRARIVSSLVALREKYERGQSGSRPGSFQQKPQRHSMADSGYKNTQQPTYEVLTIDATRQKQSKSLGDLLDMDPSAVESANMAAQEAVALKKALEWELSLDSRDLRSHAWYHGPIPRQRAEEIVQQEGDFLIRDCVSQPGNFVLTCKTKGPVLHFVINKILLQPETVYERVQYQFEDDAYDTVPDLITFYVGSGKAISLASGARIQYPCNRLYPLSFYATKYGHQNMNTMMGSYRGASPLNSPSLSSVSFSPMSSPPRVKRDTPPRLPSKKQRSHSLTPAQQQGRGAAPHEKYCSADGVIHEVVHSIKPSESRRLTSAEKCNSADGCIQNQNGHGTMARSIEEKPTSADGICHPIKYQMMARSAGNGCQSLPRTPSGVPIRSSAHGLLGTTSRTVSLNRDPSDQSLSNGAGCSNGMDTEPTSPPLKPNRNATNNYRQDYIKDLPLDHGPLNRVASYHASGSDSGNGSGDSAQSSATDNVEVVQHRGVIIKNPRFMSNSASQATLKSFSDFDPVAAEEALMAMEVCPQFIEVSKFDVENFNTLLLPSCENKPLDNGALNTFRMMLCETGPRVIANHITRVDIALILGTNDGAKAVQDPLECAGLELLTLPHGKQFRRDLIERTECIKLLVAVTILTCNCDQERAETLNKWIQVAVDTKTALGNLFGFCAIMLGLCMPQIAKLEPTWHILRQKYTDSAFNFEAKLRPTLKSMNDCSNPQAPNTTVPHLLPYILLRDREMDEILGISQPISSLTNTCVAPWESSAVDFGLNILFNHLDAARNFANNLQLYKRNANGVLNDTSSRHDELLEDAFRTEFHIKFLWGSKGALARAEDRHNKLEQVLTVMAEKFCHANMQYQQIGSPAY